MKERIDAIFQQVMDENCKDPLHRFAELVRADEREKWDTSDMAHRPGGLSVEQEKLCKYCGGIGRVVCNGKCMPEQEPVAQCTNSDTWNCKYCRRTETCEALKDSRNFGEPAKRERPVKSYTGGEPQYATDAPKREFVGLTDEEIVEILDIDNPTIRKFAYAIEAKLKERNNG